MCQINSIVLYSLTVLWTFCYTVVCMSHGIYFQLYAYDILCLSLSQTCSNEVKCICDADYTGKDCSVYDPIPDPQPPDGPEKYKGSQHIQSCGCSVLVGPASLCLCLEWNFLNVPRVSVSFSTEPFTVQRYNEELCVEIRSVKQLISGFAIGFLSHFWSIWLLVCPMLCAHMENFNLFIYLIFIYNGVSWFQKVYEALTSKHMQNHQLFLRFW